MMNTGEARVKRWQHKRYESEQSPTKVTVKVRKRGWITRGEKLIYTIVGIGLILMCYYFISYSSATDSLNREIQSVEKKIEFKQIQNENLAYEIKELSKPERIKEIAEKYGLKIRDTKVKRAHALND